MEQRENIAFDQYQRYETISRLIAYHRLADPTRTFRILELGANEHKDLALFLENDEIVFTDIQLTEKMRQDPAFQRVDGTAMPFGDGSFDFVVAADVLEHVPESKRTKFLSEAYRVAAVGAILSFPRDTAEVLDAEARVNAYYKAISGEDFIWLKEHQENGLPCLEAIDAFSENEGFCHFSFSHGTLQLWEKMWYCHFNVAVSPETLEYRNMIDRYYNCNLYAGDVGKDCYREFYVLAHVDCMGWMQHANDFYNKNADQNTAPLENILAGDMKTIVEKLAETQHVINETGRQFDESRSKLEETQRLMNETGRQLKEARDELLQKSQDVANAQRILSVTNEQLKATKCKLADRTQDLDETKNSLSKANEQLERARQDLSRKIQELDTAEALGAQKDLQIYQLQQHLSDVEQIKDDLRVHCTELETQNHSLELSIVGLRQQIMQNEQLLSDIQNSFSWKITRPLYKIKTLIYFWMEKRSFTHKIRKGISILRHYGCKELSRQFLCYCRKKKDLRQFAEQTGIPLKQVMFPNNKDGFVAYDSEYQKNEDFSAYATDVKLLAFYLPQYHSFPENDEWWGRGFTEWVNVRSGEVRFADHYQPRVPHEDIGYYCLTDISVIKNQVVLAKQHGIYGFCFYYYWFSGKRLMEKPVDMLLEHPEIDIPFCLCWANENWTRAWDGQNKNVLIAQDYSEEDDAIFIIDLKKYIDDPRYIRVNKKPLIIVYNPGQIPDPHKSFEKWRQTAQNIGLGEILIWTCQTANNTARLLHIEDCIDAEVEFPPHNLWVESIAVRDVDVGGKAAFLYNYQRLVDYVIHKMKNDDTAGVPLHRSFMMAWDNAARRKDAWFTFYAFSLRSLYRWVLAVVERSRRDFAPEERFAFVNAWNEWGEGTYLEPDEKFGYANINTVSKGLFNLPFKMDLKILDDYSLSCSPEAFEKKAEPRIAVQIHMFYLDTLQETIENLNKLPYIFDCFVSTDTEEKKKIIFSIMSHECHSRKVDVQVFPNRGRDVAPFLIQMEPVINNYDYICHIHSKKTCTSDYGNEWRKFIFHHLFDSSRYLEKVFYLFEQDDQLGIAFPETYPVLELQAEWGGNREGVEHLLQKLNCDQLLPETPIFPVGNMFWARSNAIKLIFNAGLTQSDFSEETGQTNATLAHQIERSWIYIASAAGYNYCKIFNNCFNRSNVETKNRLGIYVHYDTRNIISESDFTTVSEFSSFLSELVFVTNSNLTDNELDKVKKLGCSTIRRKNIGFDFGAWRDCILGMGRDKIAQYDELILFNNSCFRPVFNIREMFSVMESKNLDFWGDTLFPYTKDGSYLHTDCIPEHLQSYFMVFGQKVIKSKVFWEFWENVRNHGNFIDVVAKCESQFTRLLAEAGFSYEPYIKETQYICHYLNNYAIPYEKPTSLLLLKDPFVKKKCYQYMDNEEKVKLEWLLKQLPSENIGVTIS